MSEYERMVAEYDDVFVIELPAPEDVKPWHRRPRWWGTLRIRLWKLKMKTLGAKFED